jgi:UDP-4-keto-6-deoxy-N-acetylglucosamine 4-aminotransferase
VIIPYAHQSINEADAGAVLKVLKCDHITQGAVIVNFEKALSLYCGARHAVVFSSGTAALHASYYASGLGQHDNFITSPNTFAATANAGLLLGSRPIFADIESKTGNIDVTKVEANINKNTKLLVPVHYAGHPVDLKEIFTLSKKYGLKVIEDACHALGSKYEGENIGNCRYSDMTVFSFHPAKAITTGEGGAVLTNDALLRNKLLLFRNHGIAKTEFINKPHGEWYYEMQLLGYNYRLTDIQASLGLSQLKRLKKFVLARRRIAGSYNLAFCDNSFFDTPVENDYAYSAYHLYVIRLKDRYIGKKCRIFSDLRKNGLGVQVHYIPVHMHPYYRKLGYKEAICPIAENFYKGAISIPMYASLKDDEVRFVIRTIKSVMKKWCK